MTISYIIASGFRTTGIYPFNPSVILKKFSDSQKQSERDSGSVTKEVTFSPDLVKKYEKRFENGYNIYTDENYVQWLRKFHPDYLPPG